MAEARFNEAFDKFGYDKQELSIIAGLCPEGTPAAEIYRFLYYCKERGLNPILKEAYLQTKKAKQPDGSYKTVYVVIPGIDGLTRLADETECYAPGRATEFTYTETGELFSATAFVLKYNEKSKVWHEVAATAHLSEFAQDTSIWKRMKHNQLDKCARAKALRIAFPSIVGGLYDEDEFSVDGGLTPANRRAAKLVEQVEQMVAPGPVGAEQ